VHLPSRPLDPPHCRVTVQTNGTGRRLVLILEGEFDGFSAHRLQRTTDALEPFAGLTVEVDGRAVRFASAALIGALLELRNKVAAAGGTVVLVASSPILDRVLVLTQVARLFRPPLVLDG
jgi:anti-anti-sigma factor